MSVQTHTTVREHFEYYKQNQAQFVEQFNGKTIVLINKQVVGTYGSTIQAYNETIKKHELGTFFIQDVSPGEGGYTINMSPLRHIAS